jgi:N-acetylglucosaminyldiphosphoundecaprenol N-acetyl-beta-D-mannosaminyltransferase
MSIAPWENTPYPDFVKGQILKDGQSASVVDADYSSVGHRGCFNIFGVPISKLSLEQTIEKVATLAKAKARTTLVTFTNVHMLTEGCRISRFHEVHAGMDLNCPDGMPLVWIGRLTSGNTHRVCGPDFMQAFMASPLSRGLRHFFFGGGEGTGQLVIAELQSRHPGIQIAGSYTPPFREMTREEDAAAVEQINQANADVVWVCLGCPKQEIWMHEHRDRVRASVLLGVGLAFDIIAGKRSRAPKFMRRAGLEWLYRLISEPRRLMKRYAVSNTMFFALLCGEFFGPKWKRRKPPLRVREVR